MHGICKLPQPTFGNSPCSLPQLSVLKAELLSSTIFVVIRNFVLELQCGSVSELTGKPSAIDVGLEPDRAAAFTDELADHLEIGGCLRLGIKLYSDGEVFTVQAVAAPTRRRRFRLRPIKPGFIAG